MDITHQHFLFLRGRKVGDASCLMFLRNLLTLLPLQTTNGKWKMLGKETDRSVQPVRSKHQRITKFLPFGAYAY